MNKLSQHGAFDPEFEKAAREQLLVEFTESWADRCGEWSSDDFGEIMDGFDFAACQRPDGSIYGTSGQCRKGTPVSIGPKDNALALRKKALARGLKHKDVNEIYAALRDKYGQKQLKGDKMIQSLAKRINRRLGADDERPVSTPIKPSPAPKTESSKPRVAAGPKVDVVKRKEGGVHDVLLDGKRVGQMLKLPGDPRYQIDVGGKQERVTGLAMARARARALAKEQGAGAAKPSAKGNFEKWQQEREKALAGANLSGGVKGYNAAKDFASPNAKVLGKGAMGEVKETGGPPPGVVKKGMIGQNEVAALKRLEDSGVTPKFHGGAVTGKERKVSGGLGGHVTEQRGIIGMSRVPGLPYRAAYPKLGPQERDKALEEFVRVRKEIHTRGVAHNDMHSGNFFYDKKTGKGGLVDFGLAQINPRAALVEAIGTTTGRDWQAQDMPVGYSRTPMAQRLTKNIREVKLELSRMGVDPGDLPNIRSNDAMLDRVFGKNVSDKDAERLIKMVYDGI